MAKEDGALDRRGFLAAAGIAAAVAGAGSVPMAAAQPPAGMPPRVIPPSWTAAPIIDLWTGAPPENGFSARPLPMDKAPPVFMHNVDKPYLRVFRPAKSNGRAVLVIPGGAYIFISIDNEGAEVGQALAEQGYTVFVLVHRLPGEGWTNRSDVPLQDAQRAMRLIKSMAGTYGIDPDQVSVLGFSAGGHLAATLITDFAQPVYAPRDAIDRLDARPRTAGLIYPVISMRMPDTHTDSRKYLLGEKPDPALVARRSPAAHVGSQTPPTFLMHAFDDPAVPPSNSLEMLQALRVAGRPVEAHFFEEGGHGFGLGWPQLPVRQWLGLFVAFLDRHARPEG
ncbi:MULTISPECIES: alpha/beta hydrolase [Sphingobium]|uniref:alpha/beta hydrolase n=1 Tax=Sphingobium TaxID=165695 RepID=UPI0015EB4BBA|nr:MULTISPECIES: alpha/beta hydrolase [Sphingobium]MCW2362236.1 acetyl esterase/lipase [Sphingobium sp. B10D3B]MCW2401085.1 acetyl esterase/lipase [Sphingobium sp. B10D7B]MCW2408065.1 acetyl esterase/lipase [Sphingobium xanthum]